jgi:hypothetical protein
LFTPIDFSKAIASAISQLHTVQQALQGIACPQIESLTINLRDLSEERVREKLDDVPTGYGKSEKGSDYIYVIQIQGEQPGLVTALSAQLDEARKTSNDYSRLNSENKETKTLYVGRSKTLRARLKQHLGAEGRGVYSLHLQRWATGNNAEIAVSIMKFNGAEDLLVQAVEDGLWASLKPAFGRKGER